MLKNSYSGKFIVFEGLDGSGQTTQARLLKEYLERAGLKVLAMKEPTQNSSAGKKIQRILDKKEEISSADLQKLFVEDRKEHLEREILPALKRGEIVICDRYFFSTFAFGAASGLDLEWLIKLNEKFLLPDLTFILKAKPETCLQRITKRGTEKTLFEKKETMEKVWQVYEILLQRFENLFLIDAEQPIEQVFSQIKEIVLKNLKK